jgi:NAD(P) transhydrogenase
MQQGRHASCHALGLACETSSHLLPYGIYTIPEISMVGRNEDELTRDGIPYEIGVARYREIARGQIIGDTVGMLKLLFHSENRQLLGVHVIGEGATELVHIGQAVMAHGGKLITSSITFSTILPWPNATRLRRWPRSTVFHRKTSPKL